MRWLILWVVAIVVLVLIRWRRRVAGSGLVFAYLFNLSLIHWFGAFVYTFPWYNYKWNTLWYQNFNVKWIEDGFRESLYGLIAFILGSLLIAPILEKTSKFRRKPQTYLPDPRLPRTYVVTGFVCYFVLTPILGKVPSLTALISSGLSLMAVGVAIGLWNSWHEKNRNLFFRWLIFGIQTPPLLTLIGQGFMSYGTAAFLAIAAFLISFYRPRWKVVVVGLFLVYGGLSFFVTYMRDRTVIREVVWGGESWVNRIKQVYRSISDFEWFNIYNQKHLFQIDRRLNQNLLVGASVGHLADTNEYANGATIFQSLVAVVPRALWPDKPVKAGGNTLVTRFTGITFDAGTSVGIGQVMEFYANFGTGGVIFGFLCLGMAIAFFDHVARDHLLHGNWQEFAFWFVSGLGMTQAGGSLVEVTASVGGAMAMMTLANQWLYRFRSRRIIPTKQ